MTESEVRMSAAAFCFPTGRTPLSNTTTPLWLRARRRTGRRSPGTAFVYAIDVKNQQYQKNRSKITFPGYCQTAAIATNWLPTRVTKPDEKKSITNRFIREAMTDFFKEKPGDNFIRKQRRPRPEPLLRCSSASAAARQATEKGARDVRKTSRRISGNAAVCEVCGLYTLSAMPTKAWIYITSSDSALGSVRKLSRDARNTRAYA